MKLSLIFGLLMALVVVGCSSNIPDDDGELRDNSGDEIVVNETDEVLSDDDFNASLKYEPEILELFKTQKEVKVAVVLVDDFNISLYNLPNDVGERRRIIYELKKEHYLKIEDRVLTALNEEDFRLIRKGALTPSLSGYITKTGLIKLNESIDVNSIQIGTEVNLLQ